MTHCVSCDKILSDFEATRKIENTEGVVSYPDLCNRCFRESGVGTFTRVIERQDLAHTLYESYEEPSDVYIDMLDLVEG